MTDSDTQSESGRSAIESRLRRTLHHRAGGPVAPRRFELPADSVPRRRITNPAPAGPWRWVWAGGGAVAVTAGAFLIAAVWGSSQEARAPQRTTLGDVHLVAATPPARWAEAPSPTRGAVAGRQWAVAPWVSDGTSNDVVCLEEESTRSRQCQTTLVLGERGSTGALSVGPTLDGPGNTKLLPVIAGVEVTEVRIAYNDGTVDAVRANPVGSGVPAVMAVTAVPEGVSSATVTWFTPAGPGGTRYLRLSYPTPTSTGA